MMDFVLIMDTIIQCYLICPPTAPHYHYHVQPRRMVSVCVCVWGGGGGSDFQKWMHMPLRGFEFIFHLRAIRYNLGGPFVLLDPGNIHIKVIANI